MKFLKGIILILVLLISNACSLGTITEGKGNFELHAMPQKTSYFEVKSLPTHYIIEPLLDLNIEAEAAILINAATGDIIFEKNIDQSLAIASMSKIMTELLVLEAIKLGTLNWDDVIPISDYAYLISNYPGYASVQLRQDKEYNVQELFHAMAVRSANGATIALAEAVGNTEKQFVNLMNNKAMQLELRNTNFVNSTGLTNIDLKNHHSVGEVSDSNTMSANDLAMLSQYLISQFPEVIEITKLNEINFQNHSYTNSNWMLPKLHTDWIIEDVSFNGVDGLKTGYTDDAGYGFTGTVQINNRRFISVIIGTKEIDDRFLETKILYEALKQQLDNIYP